MPTLPVWPRCVDHRRDEGAELVAAALAAPVAHDGGQRVGRDDAGGDGVLEVVADVGDAVGPADDLALRRAGAGRDHEWLRMPSSVSAHRLSGVSVTSAPHTAWS